MTEDMFLGPFLSIQRMASFIERTYSPIYAGAFLPDSQHHRLSVWASLPLSPRQRFIDYLLHCCIQAQYSEFISIQTKMNLIFMIRFICNLMVRMTGLEPACF